MPFICAPVLYIYILVSYMPLGDMELTHDNLDNISMFALHMEGTGLLQSTNVNLHPFFSHKLNIDTKYLMYHHIENITKKSSALLCTNGLKNFF